MSKLTTFLDNRDKDELQEQINDKANKTDISSPYNFKGSTTVGELPNEGNEINDTYYCTDAKGKYTWNGTGWYQSSMNEYDYEEIATPVVIDVTDVKTETARMSVLGWLGAITERPKGYTGTRINSLSVKVDRSATVRFALYSSTFAAADGQTPVLKCEKVLGEAMSDPETGIAKLEIEGGYYTEQTGLFPVFFAKEAVISCVILSSMLVTNCPHFDDAYFYDNKEGDEILCSLEDWREPIHPAYGAEYDHIVATSFFDFAKDMSARVIDAEEKANGAQEKLVSGDNIKTVNGESILGEGDLEVKSGADGLTTIQDDSGNNHLFLTKEGEIIGEGVVIPQGGGGGSSGGSTNNAVMTMSNTAGWISKAVASGADCNVSFIWSSTEDGLPTGNGTLSITVGGAVKTSYEIPQGEHVVDIGKYLTAGSNKVRVEVGDAYGNTRIISYSINVVEVSISSYFDGTVAYTGQIPFSYTPVGSVAKTMHFVIDGKEVETQTVTASGREVPYTIPEQAHGSHTFDVYFTCEIDGQPVESNHLFYDLICYERGRTTPIISVPFNTLSVKQYSTVPIPYIVYTPNLITSAVELKEGTTTVANLTVDRTQQIWSYKAFDAGMPNLSIVCGSTKKLISFTVTQNNLDVHAETENLELHLSSAGRSNNEEHPLEWSSGSVQAQLTGFNLTSDGWKLDEQNNTVLRVSGDARVYIPFNIFGSDFRTTGKTIELEFATRDVLNYDAVILSSWSGDRGIQVTAQKALLKSEQSEIFTQYKEDETVRIAFTVEKKAENRLLAIYINGIMSGVVQYPADDDFSQTNPVGISIGSNDCTTDIYCIRVYGNNLTRYQILDNWIADTQDVEELLERYDRNDIFDDYGNIVVSKIPSYLPYMVLNVQNYADLPQSKGDKKTISGYYVDPLNPSRSFTFEDAEFDVQGTSSQYYSRKNYKAKYNGGFTINGETAEKYQLRPTSMPTNEFTYKADVASSEGANNVELARLYDDTCPVKTPPQIADSRVRQGIEGYPMLMFYGSGNNLTFLGKYNFNNDKGTPEVFGFAAGDESWEILQNNTEMVIWKDDDFSGDKWKTSFEARYPEDSTDVTRLAAFSSWLKSTDTTAVSSEAEKAARLQKFKDEFGNWCNVDAMLFNYIFTEMFLMVDNRAKNAFPTRYDADGKWLILPYDYDTAIGINNEGELKFGYDLEDIDHINGNNVYNGQDSVLYVNMRLAFADEIMAMYKTLRTGDVFSYDEIERRFEEHQRVWGEAVFNEDARFKYIDPLINEGNKTYLPMLQGSKAEQRKWWLYNRFRYLDSKYNAGDTLEDYIMLRSYAVADITVTPYADIYATAKFDSALVQKRALRGNTYTLENPLSGGRDAVISIYSASQLSSIGDVSGLKPGMADFSKAVKLSSLKVGDGTAGYDNPNLTDLTIGNLVLLRTLDVRNCSALTQAVDISGCTNIEHVYFDGTATTGVTLPNGGILKTLHLPATVTNLTILNQKQITDFVLPSYANISTLRIENTPIVNTLAALGAIAANSRVRLVGVDWSFETPTEVLALMDKLDTFRGLDEAGNNQDKAVVSGVIHIPALTREQLDEMNRRYPNITIDYAAITVRVAFYNGETLVSEAYLASGTAITKPTDPTKESTAQYDFGFFGWSLDGVNEVDVTVAGEENMVFHALYIEMLRYYMIRFLNGSTVLQSGLWAYGDTPEYLGDEPVPEEDYMFIGWTPEIGVVTGDMDYVAKFKYTGSVARKIVDRTVTSFESDTITKVGDYAFGDSSLTSVDLPNATSLGSYAFYQCRLTSANLPNVTSVGGNAFTGCKFASLDLPNVISVGSYSFSDSSLTSVDLPNATSLGSYAFRRCTKLTSANLPKVNTIGSACFSESSSLVTVNAPNVDTINGNAFDGCYALTSANMPNVTSLGNYAFSGCIKMTSVDFPELETTTGQYAFKGCSKLESVNMPKLKKVDFHAFGGCNALKNIDLLNVTYIENAAFMNCSALELVRLPATPPTLNAATSVFNGINSACVFSVPTGSLSAYQSETNWSALTSTYSFVEEDRA